MASIGENSMQKHLRACRRRQKRRMSTRTTALSFTAFQSARSHSSQGGLTGDSDSVYLVENILGERIVKGQKFYKVRWQGFPPEADSWEPEENLSNVLEAINLYHRRQTEELTNTGTDLTKDFPSVCANSPASVPTPPSTPGCSQTKRLRGGSEERHSHSLGIKRKHGPKSRSSGRYEYVPKHELVASKTKYFDDIRDGKIDLSSNDLYSRVKTRRRMNESQHPNTSTESVHSTSNSVQGDPEPDDVTMDSLNTCSLKHEPTSPASDSIHACGSISGFQSTVDSTESEQLKPHMTDQIEAALSEPISDMTQCYSIVEFETPHDLPLRSTADCATQSDEQMFDTRSPGVCLPSASSSFHLKVTSVDVALSPIIFDNSGKTLNSPSDGNTAEPGNTKEIPLDSPEKQSDAVGPTVSSLRKLVQDYFHLIAYTQRANSTGRKSDATDSDLNYGIHSLDDLPRLMDCSPQATIHTHGEFLEAISAQRWSLLCRIFSQKHPKNTQPSENVCRSETFFPLCENHTDPESSLDVFVAALKAGCDRPIVLDYLFRAGFDPNELISDDGVQWPILIYAVRLRRLHAVQALLDAGAHPNSVEPGPKHRTALGVAIAAGDVDMAHMLILAGANFYEVETGTTALSLIVKLINAYSSTPVQLSKLPPLSMAEAQDRRRSIDCELPSVPPPSPPSGFEIPTVPKSILFNAVIHSAATAASNSPVATITVPTMPSTQHSVTHTNNKWHHHSNKEDEAKTLIGLPSVDSLRRLYDLIAVHHARLSVRVTSLVRNWLIRAGLIQVGLVSPCQWIHTHQRSASLKFNWPHPLHWSKSTHSHPVIPILLLVHGRLIPPACYDMWMDDDGPCLIHSVCLDGQVEQKPLGRALFATTLFPLRWDQAHPDVTPTISRPQPHQVGITFQAVVDRFLDRRTCVAAMVVAVTRDHGQPPHNTGNTTLNGRGLLRPPPPARPGLPASSRAALGSPPHVSRQRSVS
ncbi:Chromobox protein 5 [Fasciola hepatica]|uniref:Chromobox protein 5 n=1 Tax=Fasciola hepatica TaxID=6192 RepID=A0A4E0R1Y4_FASHE|nr:Chromobox protein 5 [Fasciola hepatica]